MDNSSRKNIAIAFGIGILSGFLLTKFLFGGKIPENYIQKENCPQIATTPPICPEVAAEKPKEPEKPIVKLENGMYPPPLFTNEMPEVFETKHPGEFRVAWEPVPGVTKYRVRITDNKGNSLRSYSTNLTFVYPQKIPWDGSDNPFAYYKIYLMSLNEANEEGPKGEVRKVKLYKDHAFFGTSERVNPLVAPEIKSITTED